MLITVKRTKQVAQFEPVTIEFSQEVEDLDPGIVTTQMLKEVDNQIGGYLETQKVVQGLSEDRFAEMVEALGTGGAVMKSDFELLTPAQQKIIKRVNNLYHLTPSYKNKTQKVSVENEGNRK